MYKAVINDNYLCHYNKNHSKANGQFVSGDGDGDGIPNDHAARSKDGKKKKGLSKKAKIGLGIAAGVVGTAAIVGGAIGLGKEFSNASRAKKLNEATMNNAVSKGKGYIEIKVPKINMSMDRVNSRVNSMHERDQRIKEGLGNGSIGEGSIFGAGYKKVASGKYGTIYSR